MKPICFREKRRDTVLILSKSLPSVPPSLHSQGSLTRNCFKQRPFPRPPPNKSICSIIKDRTENANTMRLKITFTLNHTKVCLKIPSWLRGKGKFVLFAFYCIVFKRQRKDWKEKYTGIAAGVLVFRLQPLHPFAGAQSARGASCLCGYREVRQTSRVTQNQETKKTKMANIFTDHTSASFFLTHVIK